MRRSVPIPIKVELEYPRPLRLNTEPVDEHGKKIKSDKHPKGSLIPFALDSVVYANANARHLVVVRVQQDLDN